VINRNEITFLVVDESSYNEDIIQPLHLQWVMADGSAFVILSGQPLQSLMSTIILIFVSQVAFHQLYCL